VISNDIYNRYVYCFSVIIVNGLAVSLLAQKERGVEGHVVVKGNCSIETLLGILKCYIYVLKRLRMGI
jgi:hypothetical protein